MKRILLSLVAIVGIGAIVVSATGAFFNDTETSTGNTFTAGAIDLKIDNTSYVTNSVGQLVASPNNSWQLSDLTNQLFFSFADVKPGDIGEDTISLHVNSNDAWACMAADITAKPDNGINDPEGDAGDVTDGAQAGELQDFLNFAFWRDDGDNVYESGESEITQWVGPASGIFNGNWAPIADAQNGSVIQGGSERYVGKAWCVGTLTPAPVANDSNTGPLVRGTGFTCNGAGNNNIAQTDGLVIDLSFYSVQSRNNADFLCSSLPAFNGASGVVEVHQSDLETSNLIDAYVNNDWFFYNDTNDTVMPIDQFAGSGGQNHMESVAGSVGAKMLLNTGGSPRYNIATYKYKGVELSDINSLKYRVYDATSDSDKPFLNFNVSFNGVDNFQNRLVYVPTTLPVGAWTTVDTIQGGSGSWLYSGANWPAPNAQPGTTPKTWTQILADYPNAKTRVTDSWLGVRVGEPGPAGATGYVDWIEFNGETNDFVN